MRNSTTAKQRLALLIPALLLSACSSTTAATSDAARSSAPTTPTRPAPTTSPATSPTASPRPKASPPPALKAANGTNVKACRYAACEIIIRGSADIPLSPKFGFTAFVFTHAASDKVTFAVVRPESNNVNGYFDGPGYIGFANGVKVTVEEINASGAVLRLEPKTVNPNNDELTATQGGGITGG
jgi:hypothetical protein